MGNCVLLTYFWPTFWDPLKPTFGPTFDLLEFLGFSGPLGGQRQHKPHVLWGPNIRVC